MTFVYLSTLNDDKVTFLDLCSKAISKLHGVDVHGVPSLQRLTSFRQENDFFFVFKLHEKYFDFPNFN